MEIFSLILEAAWFLLPAYISNMMPVFVKKVNFLNTPVDRNIEFMGKPLFGRNKTYRGFFFGTLAGIVTVYIQRYLFMASDLLNSYSIIDYSAINPLVFGFLLGAGALSGDLVKSFFKRRTDIGPGKPWVPFDQSDFAIGAFVLVSLVYYPPREIIFAGVASSIVFHLAAVFIGYYLGIRESRI